MLSHDSVLKRADGSSVRISVQAFDGHAACHGSGLSWHVMVYTRGKGKRNWAPVVNVDSYRFRALRASGDNLRDELMSDFRKYVSDDEIEGAMLELWNSIRPSIKMSAVCSFTV